MMNRILHFIVVLFLIGCGTPKRIHSVQAGTINDSLINNEHRDNYKFTFTDTSLIQSGKVTITEITFKDESPNRVNSPETGNADIAGIGKVTGKIKSVRQTIIERNTTKKGERKDEEKQLENISNAIVLKKQTNAIVEERPIVKTYRWYFIVVFVLFATAIVLYIKKQPIINWIRKILSGILKIL